ncbi:MAG: DinB family protein [Bacteroidota bacterium]
MEQSRILVDMALKAWNQQISRAEKFFEAQSDDNFSKEVAPGKNRISYLMGHLVSSNDTMTALFGFGPKLYPSFEDIFSKNPDRALPQPSIDEIRKAWKETHAALNKHFEKLSVDEWLGKHTAMTDEDLAKEPTRNKLSVLISRTNHVSYHMGQLVLTKGK